MTGSTMNQMEAAPVWYRKFIGPFRRALARLKMDLEFFLQEECGPVVVIGIESRLKSFDSAVQKAQSKGLEIAKLDDLAGLRVVSGTASDTQVLCDFFRGGPRGASFETVKDYYADHDGYRARHLVIKIPSSYICTWQSCWVEVQLPTAMENAFNALSRSWVYKTNRSLSPEWEQRFVELAKALRQFDSEADDLQRELFSAAVGARSGDPIVPQAHKQIVKEIFGEDVTDEQSRWETVYYRRWGLDTCGELRDFFTHPEVLELYNGFQKLPEDNWLRHLGKTKAEFWNLYGTRLEKGREALSRELEKIAGTERKSG